MRQRCGNCGSRAGSKSFGNVVGPDGLYCEERCTTCGFVTRFEQELALDAKTCAQIINVIPTIHSDRRHLAGA